MEIYINEVNIYLTFSMALIVHHCCRIWGTCSGSAAVAASAEEE